MSMTTTPASAVAAAAPATAGAETAEQALLRAQAAAQAKRFGEASGICQDVLAQSPDHPAAMALLGIVAGLRGDIDQGIIRLERAIQLRPGTATWYAHLSSLYRMTYRTDEALATGQEAVRLDPNNTEHLIGLSLTYSDRNDRMGAISCLLRALGLKHEHADGHLALAQNLLAMGDYEAGLMEYEWRNKTEAGKATIPAMTSAPWNGMQLPNGRLLLVGDQGYGDAIQFARFIPMAAERCAEVVLGGSVEMRPLLGKIPGVSQYCHRWADIPGHVAHCRLSSLPYLFGVRLNTIPASGPYMKADPARVAAWRERLDQTLPPRTRRIGLAWSGRPSHPNDRRRSIALSRLLPLSTVSSAVFVSLQKPMPAADRAFLPRFAGMADLSEDLTDFGETAALMENLDLIITVDTSMGHLAGALGRPVWIMIPQAADWRWLIDREDSPWYPTARLFRQQTPGAWDVVIDRVRDALAVRSRRRSPAAQPVAVGAAAN